MPSTIVAIYCQILFYSRSASALRVAEVDDDSSATCPPQKAGAQTCMANACCSAKLTELNLPGTKSTDECLKQAKSSSKNFVTFKSNKCVPYATCKKKEANKSCGGATNVPAAEVYQVGSTVKGDPHVVNMAGEKFDILTTGTFSLLSLTRATQEELMINGTIARFGAKCGESFITDLEHTGGWIRKAYNTEALKVRAVQDTPKKQALQINFGQKWEPLSHLQEMAHVSKTEDVVQFDLSSVSVEVSPGKHWRHGWNFLNLDVRGLAGLGDNIRVGGLLGFDDHTQVLEADADCAMFAKTAGTDMQDPQSCLSYLKAN